MTQDETETDTPATFTDESIFCSDCGMEFIHTAAEKAFFAKMKYTNKPRRCVACRKARKVSKPGASTVAAALDNSMYEIVCSVCGKIDHVPFAPKPERKVYCHECHIARVKGAREKAKRDGCPARK